MSEKPFAPPGGVSLPWRRIAGSSVTTMLLGTVAGQAILLAGSPLLTRLFSPEDFGGFAIFLGISSTIAVAASLSYQLAIPLPNNRRTAINIVVLAAIALVASSVLLTMMGMLLSRLDLFTAMRRSPVLAYPAWLGACVLAIGGYQILFYWSTREGAFRRAGLARVAQSCAQTVGQLGAGIASLGMSGLVAGYVAGQFVALGFLWRGSRWPWGSVRRSRIALVARRYRKFPQLTLWGSLANAAGTQLPPVLVGAWFGLAVAGHLALALRVLALPAALLGQAVAQVFFPRAAAAAAEPARLRSMLTRATTVLLVVAFVCFVPVILLGAELFPRIFGSQWADAGEFARWIALWSAGSLISSPISTLPLILDRQGRGLIVSLSETALRFTALGIGAGVGSPTLAVRLFACAGLLISVVYVCWVFVLTGTSLRDWLRGLRYFLLGSGVLIVAGVILRPQLPALPLAASLGIGLAILGAPVVTTALNTGNA